MHRLLSTERAVRDASGHHRAQTAGWRRSTQSNQTTPPRDFSPAPANIAGRMGCCAQSSPRSRQGPLSGPGTGTATPLSREAAGRVLRAGSSALKLFLLGLIRFYQICLSPTIPSSCRYYPSCSAYAYEAVAKWGAWKGTKLTVGRLLRCRPWGGHGYDPVP